MDKPGFKRLYPARLSWPDDPNNRPPCDGTLVLTGDRLLFYLSGTKADDPLTEPFQIVKIEHKTGISAEFGRYFDLAVNDQVLRFTPEPGQAVVVFADLIRARSIQLRAR